MSEQTLSNEKLDINQVLSWLQADDKVSGEHLEKCCQHAVMPINKGKHPLKVIADAGVQDQTQMGKLLTLESLTAWLADKVGLPYYYIDPLKIDIPSVTTLYSKNYAFNYNILPITFNKNEIVVATAEPYVRIWEADLLRMHKCTIKRVLSNPDDITRYLGEFYSFAKSLKGATLARANDKDSGGIQNIEQLLELSKASDLDANNQHIVNLVNWLLQFAFDQRASDIHIEPRRNTGTVRFRIDGILHNVYQLPQQIMNAVLSRLKILGRMNIAEKRLPQDGRIKTQNNLKKEIELRLSTMPTAFGEKLVMRIFRP